MTLEKEMIGLGDIEFVKLDYPKQRLTSLDS
jgi:hypothetical protein